MGHPCEGGRESVAIVVLLRPRPRNAGASSFVYRGHSVPGTRAVPRIESTTGNHHDHKSIRGATAAAFKARYRVRRQPSPRCPHRTDQQGRTELPRIALDSCMPACGTAATESDAAAVPDTSAQADRARNCLRLASEAAANLRDSFASAPRAGLLLQELALTHDDTPARRLHLINGYCLEAAVPPPLQLTEVMPQLVEKADSPGSADLHERVRPHMRATCLAALRLSLHGLRHSQAGGWTTSMPRCCACV